MAGKALWDRGATAKGVPRFGVAAVLLRPMALRSGAAQQSKLVWLRRV